MVPRNCLIIGTKQTTPALILGQVKAFISGVVTLKTRLDPSDAEKDTVTGNGVHIIRNIIRGTAEPAVMSNVPYMPL